MIKFRSPLKYLLCLSLLAAGCSPKNTVDNMTGPPQRVFSGVTAGSLSAAPTSLLVVPTGPNSIVLKWQDNASDETGFNVYRSFDNSTFTLVSVLGANSERYEDKNKLFPNTTYYYKVTAFNGVGETAAVTGNATTFVGQWAAISNSSSGTGLSGSVISLASKSSSATDSNTGRTIVVYEGLVNGSNNIFAMVFDPNLFDSNNLLIGWKPILMNATVGAESQDSTSKVISVGSWGALQKSNEGGGISQAVGKASEPQVVYNSTLREFIVVWQEVRNGYYRILGRRIKLKGYRGNVDSFYGTTSDGSINLNFLAASGAPNPDDDDAPVTSASTWFFSTAGEQAIHPQIASLGNFVFGVWQHFATGATNYQIDGSVETAAMTTTAYPILLADQSFQTTPTNGAMDAGAISNTGTGISASATAGENAINPTIAVGKNGTNNIYIAWQQYVNASSTYTMKLRSCASMCNAGAAGNSFQATQTPIASNGGNMITPRLAVDANDVVYAAWADNSASTKAYNAYVIKGSSAAPPVFAPAALNDGTYTPSDTTSGGVSNSTLSVFSPSIGIQNTTIYLSWVSRNTGGVTNIFARMYDSGVPTETPAWKSLGTGSDTSGGVTNNSGGGAIDGSINVTSSGSVDLSFTNFDGQGVSSIYFLRY